MKRAGIGAVVILILFGCESCTALNGKVTWRELASGDFSLHSSVDGNAFLVLGNVPVSKTSADLPDDIISFLGRWEGYDFGVPVKRDLKIVLVVKEE